MKIILALWLTVVLAGCSTPHQNLKAPYDIQKTVPVLNQWGVKGKQHGE